MKKIVYLTIFANPFQFELIEALKKELKGIAVFIPIYEKSIPEHRKHWGQFKNGIILEEGYNFEAELNRECPDLLLFTMYNSKFTAKGIKWAIKNKKPYYMGPHEVIKSNGVHPFMKWLKLQYYKLKATNSDGIITMGNEAIRDFSKLLPNKRVIDVPYSFDLTRLLSFENTIQQGELTFIVSGGLYDFRNPLLAIRCFAEVVEANPNFNLNLLISGNGPLKLECEKMIRRLNLSNMVKWDCEYTNWYDIHNLYNKGNVLLALQNYGTWGLIIQEAMAAGLGIVSSNTIQSADTFIISGYNGYLTNLNMDMIVGCMQNYIDDHELIKLHASRNRIIVKQVDVSHTSKKLIDFITPSL